MRARLFSTPGTPTTLQWTHRTCLPSEYAKLTGKDAITCQPCPEGGDCTGATLRPLLLTAPGPSNRVIQQQHIVAQTGYWASSESNGLAFFKCRNGPTATCLQGVNGTRSTCAAGYSTVLCNVCSVGYAVGGWRTVGWLGWENGTSK